VRACDGGIEMNDKLTSYQAVVLTGYTGILMCSFSEYHADVEARLGYPVFTHQFGDEEFTKKLKEIYQEEFLSLVEA
jgi:hypothetical protein